MMRRFLKVLTIVSALSGSVLCDSTLALEKYVTPAGGGLLDGSDWDNAYSNIQDAVNACTTLGDAIYLKYGVYTNFSQIEVTNRPGLTIRGGYAGAGTPGGFTNEPSAITRDLSVSNRIFYCNVSTLTLDRVTITNGSFTNIPTYGGGLFLTNCQTFITNCTLQGNKASRADGGADYGGGIYAVNGTLTVTESTLRNNFSYDAGNSTAKGGGIYASGVPVTLTAVTFDRNYAYSYTVAGGGVYLTGGSGVIRDCTFRTNYSSGYYASYVCGGVVYATGVNPLTVSNCFFTRNYLTVRAGGSTVTNGAVMYVTGGTMTMSDCEITDNSYGSIVESLYIDTTGSVSFRNSIFTGGSGNSIYKTGSGSLLLTNCLIHSNPGHGLRVNTGPVTVANCTLANNVGWGLTNASGTVTIRDSIAWENTAGGITTNGSVTVSYTCSQEPIVGAGNLSVDPRVITRYYLSVNGLMYQTTNSPCIDAGSATASALGLDTRTTRTDGMNDSGQVDLGYHATNGVPGITNLVLYVDVVNGSDANNGWTPGTALKTVTAGLSNAIDGSTINIATGAYNPAAGERFPLTLPDVNLTLKGTNQVSTVIDAVTTDRVFEVWSKGRVWMESLTITNGCPTNTPTRGGGLYLIGCQTTMTNCTLQGNKASRADSGGDSGGGIYAVGGTLTVTESALRNNFSYDTGNSTASGGGLYASGVAVTLSAVTFDRNYAYSYQGYGGGVYLSGGSAVIRGCAFRTNYASGRAAPSFYEYGGALYATGVNPLTISNCVFSRNYVTCNYGSPPGANGGVMYLTGIPMVEMVNCEITGNSGGVGAENVYINTDNSVSFRNSIFLNGLSNSITKTGSGTLSLTNCLICSNAGHGVSTATGTVEVVNTTLANNTGWGVSNASAVVTIRNSIAWGNTNGGFTANCALTYTDSQEAHAGAGNLNADPVFVGAATNDYRLSLASPCVNTGTNEAWMVNATDLGGGRRIRMGRVDMGAYETIPPQGSIFVIRGR